MFSLLKNDWQRLFMNKIIKISLSILLAAAIIAGLYFVSRYNYLLFHYIVEFSSITIGVSIFIIAINTAYITTNVFMLFIGTSFFTSAVLDFLHTLSYKGQSIFIGFDSNLPTQLWISARFFQILGLLISIFIIDRLTGKKCKIVIPTVFSLSFIALILLIFVFKVFPVCYIEEIGITLFKKIAEYVFSALALATIILYFFKRKKIGKRNYNAIVLSLTFFILCELSFTLYNDVNGFFNMIGHIFKFISFYFIYILFIESNLKDPFTILFNNLKGKNSELEFVATHDSLTGLSNQASVFEQLRKQFDISSRFKKDFAIIMIDIDDFKMINDSCGHPAGDKALRLLARVIKKTVRDVDIKGRYGGDEFLLSPLEVKALKAVEIAQKIQENLRNEKLPDNCPFNKFTISAGVSGIRSKRTFDEVLNKADRALMKSKQLGKDRVTLIR